MPQATGAVVPIQKGSGSCSRDPEQLGEHTSLRKSWPRSWLPQQSGDIAGEGRRYWPSVITQLPWPLSILV